jgi:hypothetical protein
MQSPVNTADDSVLPPDDISVMAMHDGQPGTSAGKKTVTWDDWFNNPQFPPKLGTFVLSLM